MEQSAPARPRQVTFVAWAILVGSVAVVLFAFQRVANLGTLEAQEEAADFVSRPPGEGLGLSADQALELIRVSCLIAAACATATAILGYFVLQRSHSARIGLSVLALPVMVAGSTSAGVLSAVVAAAVVSLWLQPARNWFAGLAPPEPPRLPPVPATSAMAGAAGPPATTPPGPTAPAPDAASPVPWPPRLQVDPDRRPGAVLWACVLTWVGSGLVAGGSALSALTMAVASEDLLDTVYEQNPELTDQGIDPATLETVTYVTAGVLVLWSLAAAAVALLVFRRSRAGRVALLCSAGAAAGLCLIGTFAAPLLAALLAVTASTLTLLFRPEVRAWFDRPPPPRA